MLELWVTSEKWSSGKGKIYMFFSSEPQHAGRESCTCRHWEGDGFIAGLCADEFEAEYPHLAMPGGPDSKKKVEIIIREVTE